MTDEPVVETDFDRFNGTAFPRVCEYRWTGPRPEVRDSSVRHVCALADEHDLPHRCGCGAETPHRIEVDE